jgi:hypothetical protein
MAMFAAWPRCTKMILGGSHDNGYARVLSKLLADNIVPGRVVLLQGPPFAVELAQLSTTIFPRIHFEGLFMNAKLEPGAEKVSSYVQVASSGVVAATASALKPPKPRSPSNATAGGTVLFKFGRLPDKGNLLIPLAAE